MYEITQGWVKEVCDVLVTACTILRGKMRTEKKDRLLYPRQLIDGNDETVALFRVSAGGAAHLHYGQDARVNVHLCLWGCNRTVINIAGVLKPYEDGGFFAFEDRADHEIINHGTEDRINLVIGVLHPSFRPMKHRFPIRGFNLEYVLANLGRMSGARKADYVIVATYYNYTEALEQLLAAGAAVNATTEDGQTALHVAASRGFFACAQQLVDAGADVRARDRHGQEPLHFVANTSAPPRKFYPTVPSSDAVRVTALLRAAGADPAARARSGSTPLDLAVARGSANPRIAAALQAEL